MTLIETIDKIRALRLQAAGLLDPKLNPCLTEDVEREAKELEREAAQLERNMHKQLGWRS